MSLRGLYYSTLRRQREEIASVRFRFTWVSRDGTHTRVRDMHDAHLLNAVRLVRRVYAEAAARLGVPPSGHGFVVPTAEQLVSLHPTWAALQAELVERQLDELPVW